MFLNGISMKFCDFAQKKNDDRKLFFSADRIFEKSENLGFSKNQKSHNYLKELVQRIRLRVFFTVKKTRAQADRSRHRIVDLSSSFES